jgi:hypothetical protein
MVYSIQVCKLKWYMQFCNSSAKCPASLIFSDFKIVKFVKPLLHNFLTF